MTVFPSYKVSITHSGTTTDYTDGSIISNINVKRRENNYDTATIHIIDTDLTIYLSEAITKFDTIEVSFKYEEDTAFTKVFGGTIRQVKADVSSQGEIITLLCKGYAAVLEETYCNGDMGEESNRADYDTVHDILANVITDYVNKSFGGSATGHALTHTISTFADATPVKFINNPYRSNIEIVDVVCNLSSAIMAGVAGGHYIVTPDNRFLFGKVGDHAAGSTSPEAYWPDWWNTNQAGSTLTLGTDFFDYSVLNKNEEYANNVLFLTDFRKPSWDTWTTGHAADWGNYNSLTLSDETTLKVVGASSLKIATSASGNGEAYYPSTDDAGWNVTKWGSEKTIPRLNFYMYHANDADTGVVSINLNETRGTTWLYCVINVFNDPADEWVHHSIPIGPYWATAEENRQYRWKAENGADWDLINSIGFYLIGSGSPAPAATELYIDDLHFSGKVIRSAKNSQAITAYKEYQKTIIARNAMDDSCVATDDTGFAGRCAYAELLRRINPPKTYSFTIAGKPSMMPGQKAYVQETVRLLTVEHSFSPSGFTTTCTATTDLTNSFPLNSGDQYEMWIENMFLNSAEARNMRGGSGVDSSIAQLVYDYGP